MVNGLTELIKKNKEVPVSAQCVNTDKLFLQPDVTLKRVIGYHVVGLASKAWCNVLCVC